MTRRAVFLLNPASGHGRLARQDIVGRSAEAWKHAGWETELVPIAGPGTATEQTCEIVSRGCDVLFACGGDGTVHEILQGLVTTRAETAMGIVPLGTGNVVANNLGLPHATALVSDLAQQVFALALFAWMFIVAARAVHVATKPGGRHRRLFAILGGAVVIAPIWFAPLVGPLEPWWREYDAAAAGAMNPASEPVLAAQDFLMDRALDDLEDGRSGTTDLYFVGFAPDGRHPGFVSDVEAAQRAMNARWNSAGRSLVLVNSPLTVAERPFATITNLRSALLEIGDLIDADEDIVMVYLTGGPGAGTTLAAVNPPLELVNLSPAGLRQLLDAAGIRFRIVVVSTCRAGAWVDELSDDETAVIASSAAGVQGDDCHGGLVPTRFGDAFFAAMGRTKDLAGAFEAARKRLAALGAPVPTMTLGPVLAEHLKALQERRGTITTAANRSFPAAPSLFPRAEATATIASSPVSR